MVLDRTTWIEFRTVDTNIKIGLKIVVVDLLIAGLEVSMDGKPVDLDYFRIVQEKNNGIKNLGGE